MSMVIRFIIGLYLEKKERFLHDLHCIYLSVIKGRIISTQKDYFEIPPSWITKHKVELKDRMHSIIGCMKIFIPLMGCVLKVEYLHKRVTVHPW